MKKKAALVDADFMRSLLKVKGMSEAEFADIIGVSHSYVNRVINGKRGAGSKFILGVVSNFPEVSMGQLFSHDKSLPKGNIVKKNRVTA